MLARVAARRASLSARRQLKTNAATARSPRELKHERVPSRRRTLEDVVKPLALHRNKEQASSSVASMALGGTASSAGTNVGVELTGALSQMDVSRALAEFADKPTTRRLAAEHGVNDKLFDEAFQEFRRFCLYSDGVPPELHVTLTDISAGHAHVDDIFPHFLDAAKRIYPHIECIEELQKVSDLRHPHNWYPEARAMNRKIIFHAGPTNSGKTYQALERYMESQSGVYCGPLKLLASEAFHKTNNMGVDCDLVTGEERRYAVSPDQPSAHISCTVEMVSTTTPYETAVVDEVQMMRDQQRGWAWTRAVLGVCAKEVHLCGEAAAIGLVRRLVEPCGEVVEVNNYHRLTPLRVLDEAVGRIDRVRPGDCIVCFSKKAIFDMSRRVEDSGQEVAVIYGQLPPGTKLAQAAKFNDPADPCKVLVSTDAIGMGLNLAIKRIIFHSISKTTLLDAGEREVAPLSTSQALQIGGRAGRFGLQFVEGEVTAFRDDDIEPLKKILSQNVEEMQQAGLFPTFEQIQMFSYFLPKARLPNLLDIFISMSNVDDSKYFMCHVADMRALAEDIDHIDLTLQVKYTFCLSPISRDRPLVLACFIQFARRFASGQPLTLTWLCDKMGWPFEQPTNLADLVKLEQKFDIMDLYLWLGCRYQDMFPDMVFVREMQKELDLIIERGVANITNLLRKQPDAPDDDEAEWKQRQKSRQRHAAAATAQQTRKSKSTPPPSAKPPAAAAKPPVAQRKSKSAPTAKPAAVNSKLAARSAAGSVTQRLLDAGLLTASQLEEVKKELFSNRADVGVSPPKPKPKLAPTVAKSKKKSL